MYKNFCWLSLAIFIGLYQVAHCQETSPAPEQSATPQVVTKPAEVETEDPPFRNLDAALFMQSSAEYHAICLQTYNLALMRVESQMKDRDDPRPAAVVLDLDETVLNNGAYQSGQLQDNRKFDQKEWEVWEDSGMEFVTAIPGVQDFITRIKALNVQPIYITNRNAQAKFQTLEILERLGIDVDSDYLLCADTKTGSNKTTRRAEINATFDVILLVGDNLRDFDELFKYSAREGVEGRKQLVDDHKAYWGKRWIVLPNPAYGEWTKPLGNGSEDLKYLMPAFPPKSDEPAGAPAETVQQ
jgi:5'-nucleotidase (lipoprotein e(P4) family)